MTAPRLWVREVRFYERAVRLRLPFRFGAVTVTEANEALVRVRVEDETGGVAWGAAAELLAPKWFDKDPALSNDDNMEQLRQSLRSARGLYLDQSGAETAFGLFARRYQPQLDACAAMDLNPLIACYGPALLDRAILDGLARLLGCSFYALMTGNAPGVEATAFASVAPDFDVAKFLAGLRPARSIQARHTVGLADPLTQGERAGARLDDGLPETLEEVITTYGHRTFKIKVSGELEADLARLGVIAAILDRDARDYSVSLDGNEQFGDIGAVATLWQAIRATPRLEAFAGRVMYLEQPIRRASALTHDVHALAGDIPLIIDESDGDFDAFPRAKTLGYAGVSSKTCKGVYRSIINLARARHWSESGDGRYFLTGEDLTTLPGLGVQQDLALVALLGLGDVERNGHHYVRGMAGRSAQEQADFLEAHPDLYERRGGLVRMRIRGGEIALGSLDCVGFASVASPDWAAIGAMAG